MSHSLKEIDRADSIAGKAIDRDRHPTDTAGMDEIDEEWMLGKDGREDLITERQNELMKIPKKRVEHGIKIPKEEQIKEQFKIYKKEEPYGVNFLKDAKRFFEKNKEPKDARIKLYYGYLEELYESQNILCRFIAMGLIVVVQTILEDGFISDEQLNQLHGMYPEEYICEFPEDFDLGEDIDVNRGGTMVSTPLVTAVEYRNPDIVRVLLQKGAKPDLEDENGDTAQDFLDKYKPSEKTVKEEIESLLEDARQKQASKKKRKKRKKTKKKSKKKKK